MAQLAAGDQIPELVLPNQNGCTVTPGDLCASMDEGVIVYFYPKACTPGCTKEACDFRDPSEALEAVGYATVGISLDPEGAQAKFSDRYDLPLPLLSDADHTVMEAWGMWGEKRNYGRVYTGIVRPTVVMAPDGSVALAQYNVRATGHVKRLRTTLGAD